MSWNIYVYVISREILSILILGEKLSCKKFALVIIPTFVNSQWCENLYPSNFRDEL